MWYRSLHTDYSVKLRYYEHILQNLLDENHQFCLLKLINWNKCVKNVDYNIWKIKQGVYDGSSKKEPSWRTDDGL